MKSRRVLSIVALLLLSVLIATPASQAQAQNLAERNSPLESQTVIGLPEDDEDDDEDGDGSPCTVPDPPCFSTYTRFTDCGNGTVTDGLTGLIWLKNANCLGFTDWASANDLAASLGDGTHPACELTDGSSPGDWRLPTLECSPYSFCDPPDSTGEFVSIIASTCPAPFIPDTSGTGCWSEGDPFTGVLTNIYWSSTCCTTGPVNAWGADLHFGYVFIGVKFGGGLVWPVRAGH